ncbi:MAG: arginase [Alphaproteobacteria bacterium]|nr:arginase [Alphaproteobacteria bacterium]
MKKKPIRLIPYQCGCGAFSAGAEAGALALARSGLVESLRGQGLDIAWWRDPETAEYDYRALGLKTRPAAASPAREDVVYFHLTQLAQDVEEVVRGGFRAVTIGGDHSMAMGSVAGLAKAKNAAGKTGLVWIDAHPDIHTMKTSRRKTYHAVPLSFLLGEGGKKFAALVDISPVLKPQHIAYVGLRSIDEPELHQIARYNIKTFTNGDLDQFGLKEALTQSIAHISKGTKARFLSLDLDGIDPAFAPGVGTAVPGGIEAPALLKLLKTLGRRADFDVIEIAEYNPALDHKGKTAALVDDILAALLV